MFKLLHFTADWCQPCKKIKPLIEEYISNNPGVEYNPIDIEEDFDSAKQYNVMSIPTLIVLKDGEVYNRHTGMTTPEKIASLFE